jgi:hypothetical protein
MMTRMMSSNIQTTTAMRSMRRTTPTRRMTMRPMHRMTSSSSQRRAAKSDDVNWEQKTKEFTSERLLASCLDAMAAGDEAALEACLLEVDDALEDTAVSSETIKTLQKRPEVSGDAFWTQKLKELSAERVFEDCMTAVMRGDIDEVEACIVDAESDELLRD